MRHSKFSSLNLIRLITAIGLTLAACNTTTPITPPSPSSPVSPPAPPSPPSPPSPPAPPSPPSPPAPPSPPPTPGGPDLAISKLEWGQSVLNENLKLVAGKPALFRVYVTASTAGLSTQVQASFSSGGNPLGTVTLDGPATVPTSVNQADLTQSYRAVLPGGWVKAGLQVALQVDPSNTVGESDEANNFKSVTANVGAGTVLYVTVVPVVQNNLTGVVPAGWEQLLTKLWPLQGVDIKIREPFVTKTPSGASSPPVLQAGGDGWSTVLRQLGELRVQEDKSKRYYYGFAKVNYTSGVAGIGVVGGPIGMGWDYPSSAPGIAAHEIGHNFGLWHAPCGTKDGLDQEYPVSNGKLDGWGIDVPSLKLYAPTAYSDVMSYCGPSWVSSHMYNKVQTALEASPPQPTSVIINPAISTADQSNGIDERLVIISGSISNGKVELSPLEGFTGRASDPRPGSYTLRLESSAGVFETPFESLPIAHGDTSIFTFTVPDRGRVNALEIWQSGTRLLRQEAGVRPLSVWTEPELLEQSGQVTLRWDASAFRSATLAHVATDGERTVVGLQLGRSPETLDVRGLPAGGRFELTLSDGLNSVQRTFQR